MCKYCALTKTITFQFINTFPLEQETYWQDINSTPLKKNYIYFIDIVFPETIEDCDQGDPLVESVNERLPEHERYEYDTIGTNIQFVLIKLWLRDYQSGSPGLNPRTSQKCFLKIRSGCCLSMSCKSQICRDFG